MQDVVGEEVDAVLDEGEKFIWPLLSDMVGAGNQLMEYISAAVVARSLNRTLCLTPFQDGPAKHRGTTRVHACVAICFISPCHRTNEYRFYTMNHFCASTQIKYESFKLHRVNWPFSFVLYLCHLSCISGNWPNGTEPHVKSTML